MIKIEFSHNGSKFDPSFIFKLRRHYIHVLESVQTLSTVIMPQTSRFNLNKEKNTKEKNTNLKYYYNTSLA